MNFAAADGGVISVRNEVVNRNFYEETTGTLSQEGATSRLTLNLNGFSERELIILSTWCNYDFTILHFCLQFIIYISMSKHKFPLTLDNAAAMNNHSSLS